MGSFLEGVLKVLRRSIQLAGIPEEVYEVLSKPERILTVSIPIRMDGGSIKVFEGYRVQHSSALGPYKGGVRFHPEVTLEDDVALAMLMTIKNSLNGLPYGGGKGAVKVEYKKLSRGELERLSRGYARAIAPLIGDLTDIPAPDVGTDAQVMAWMVDEYSKLVGRNVPGVFTDKPPVLWGNPVRAYSTGFGVAVVAREAARRYLGGIEHKTVAVHGFGNVGQYAAYWASRFGAKVVAVSDTSGSIHNPDGIQVAEAMKAKGETGKVANYMKAKFIGPPDEVLYLDVDVLLPSAMENVITKDNVSKVAAKLIVEGANGPVTPEAEEALYERGVTVIPDILANAGGVVASYLEWVENLQWYFWDEGETLRRLEELMMNNFARVYNKYDAVSAEHKVTMRDVAFMLSVERVYQAMKARGWI